MEEEARAETVEGGATMINTRIIEIDPRELKLLKMNARFMRHEEFQRLVANIKQDGQLTSAPFAALDPADGKYEVLSGNHRTQAAISAGLEKIPCIVTDDELSEEQRIAIQLSHNAIVGQDDPDILKKLYDKILDIDLKEYSGLDDKTLGLLDKAQSQAMSEANLEFQVLSIVYLPDELKEAQRIIDKAREAVKSSAVWLATDSEYEKWLDAQETVSAAYNVKNVSAAMQLIFKVFEEHLGELAEGWAGTDPKNDNTMWVPLSTVLGRSKIPVGSAKVIKKALDRMVGHGDITNKNLWEGLEYLCADYLGGD